jgi:DNA-3-methyladenine glycosylase I
LTRFSLAQGGPHPKPTPGSMAEKSHSLISADGKKRCAWAGTDPLSQKYHDKEWGVPVTDDHKLFEFLILEGAQAGLSWSTILKRRSQYRKAFANFDPEKVARFGAKDRTRLMKDAGIIRNRLKIESAISNARAFLAIQEEFGSFAKYAWGFRDQAKKRIPPKTSQQVPATSVESDRWSKDMKKRGFRFCGPTILYAFQQATGMVNDHLEDCFRRKEIRLF